MHSIAQWCNEGTFTFACRLKSPQKYKSKQAEGLDVYMSENDNPMPA
jgi:hypothetical protein